MNIDVDPIYDVVGIYSISHTSVDVESSVSGIGMKTQQLNINSALSR